MKLQIHLIHLFIIAEYFQFNLSDEGATQASTNYESSTSTASEVFNSATSATATTIMPISCFSNSTISEFQLPKLNSLILKMSYKISWKETMTKNEKQLSQIIFYVSFSPNVNIEPTIKFTFDALKDNVQIQYCSDSEETNCVKFEGVSTNFPSKVSSEWQITKTENEIILQKSIFESNSDDIMVSMFALDGGTNCDLAFINLEAASLDIQNTTTWSTTKKIEKDDVEEEDNSWSHDVTILIVFSIVWILVILVPSVYLIVSKIAIKEMMAYKSPFS